MNKTRRSYCYRQPLARRHLVHTYIESVVFYYLNSLCLPGSITLKKVCSFHVAACWKKSVIVEVSSFGRRATELLPFVSKIKAFRST